MIHPHAICPDCARANDGQCRAHATTGEATQAPVAPHVLIEFWRDEIAYRVVRDGETRRLEWSHGGTWTLDRTCDMEPRKLPDVLHEEQADLIAMRAGEYDRVTPKVLVSLARVRSTEGWAGIEAVLPGTIRPAITVTSDGPITRRLL